MSGTNRTRDPILGGPAIVLVNPQLGENIGTAARAMLNFGLTDLRLVNPRDGWPNEHARKASSNADAVIDSARVYASTEEALADLSVVWAATARPRDLVLPEAPPRTAASEMRAAVAAGERPGVIFGAERSGLDNDDIALAGSIISVPVNPAYASLNLAQAVLLVGYEWFQEGLEEGAKRPTARVFDEVEPLAGHQDLVNLFEHLEGELDASGYLKPVEKRPRMVRNLRAIFQRAKLYEREVRTLRGMIKALSIYGGNRGGGPGRE